MLTATYCPMQRKFKKTISLFFFKFPRSNGAAVKLPFAAWFASINRMEPSREKKAMDSL